VYASTVPRLALVCTLCGDPFSFAEPRTRTTVQDGRRTRVVVFHAACNPRALAELRARRLTPASLDRHLAALGVLAWRARRIAAAITARPPPPPPGHLYWYLLRTLRRTPPGRREALLSQWYVRDRIDDALSWALASITDWFDEVLRFPKVRRAAAPRGKAAPLSRTVRLRLDDDLVIVRALKGRTDASAYVRRSMGTSARARPIYRDMYLGRVDAEVFARRALRELRRVLEPMHDALPHAPRIRRRGEGGTLRRRS
jgi:hypothetical protein